MFATSMAYFTQDEQSEGEWDLQTRDDRLQRLALEVRSTHVSQSHSM